MAGTDPMTDGTQAKPITLGHEGVGVIEKLHGSAVGKGFKEGDTVGFLYILGCCFECSGCQIHNTQCETGKQTLQGFTADGFFAEYALVDYHNAVILPKTLDPKTAAPIFCAGITGKIKYDLLMHYANNSSFPCG